MNLKNNVILLTGGTSGIGLELSRQFLALGNEIIAVSGNAENLTKLQKDFPQIQTIVCDLGNENSVKDLLENCRRNFRNINIIINNAGVQHRGFWENERNDFDKISWEITVNFTSPMQIIYGLLPILLEKNEAAIVNVSSGLAFAPKKDAPIYCGTKAAVHNTTKALRYQLENTSVKVFEIIPPLVDTPMTKGRGAGKISTNDLVDEFIRDFANDKFESNIGKVKILRIVQRISPKLVEIILKRAYKI
jgi:short-subunit dehydrogenase involved in D-alanine esterification of teichoic acids